MCFIHVMLQTTKLSSEVNILLHQQKRFSDICILGDCNVPSIRWDENIFECLVHDSYLGLELMNYFNFKHCGLIKCVLNSLIVHSGLPFKEQEVYSLS